MPEEYDEIEFVILKILTFNQWQEILSCISAAYNILLIFGNENQSNEIKIEKIIHEWFYNIYPVINQPSLSELLIPFFSQLDLYIEEDDRIKIVKMDVGSPDGFKGKGTRKFINKLDTLLASSEPIDNFIKDTPEPFEKTVVYLALDRIRKKFNVFKENRIIGYNNK